MCQIWCFCPLCIDPVNFLHLATRLMEVGRAMVCFGLLVHCRSGFFFFFWRVLFTFLCSFYYHQKSSDFHQHVPTKNTEDPLAKYHQQLRSLGKNQPSANRRRDQKKKMAMDRAHPEETTDKHHTPGPDLEPSGEEKERPTKEHLEKRPGGGRQADRLLLERVGANRPGRRTLAGCCG